VESLKKGHRSKDENSGSEEANQKNSEHMLLGVSYITALRRRTSVFRRPHSCINSCLISFFMDRFIIITGLIPLSGGKRNQNNREKI
jgi:hypothetical protein